MDRSLDYSKEPHYEIEDAVFAVLSKNGDWKHLWWISVGLVNDELSLKWHSAVNHESEHAKEFCGDSKNGEPAKCKAIRGCSTPPCILDNIAKPCSFRTALSELEDATMHPQSHSQGRISLILWDEFKQSPYISIHKPQHPWLFEKLKIKQSLQFHSKRLLRKRDPSHYDRIAKKCLKSKTGEECSAALIPLLQHRSQGDNAYVGAIVVCASSDCGIWRDLPQVRAVVTSLLETRRHIKAIVSRKDKHILDMLLDELVADLRVGRNLFDGHCDHAGCATHKTDKNRHECECRLIRKKTFFTGVNKKVVFDDTLESQHFQKSLFSMGKIENEAGRGILSESKKLKSEKPAESHATTLKSIATFFRDALGIHLEVKNAPTQNIVWPVRPGLLTLIGLHDVFCVLNRSRRWVRSARRLVARIKNAKGRTTITFEYSLRNDAKHKPNALKSGVESEGAGEASRIILDVCHGKPTRELLPQLPWESKIIEALNSKTKDKVITPRFELKQHTPKLCLEWECEHIKRAPASSSCGD